MYMDPRYQMQNELVCEDVFVRVVASFGPKKASETILEHERFPGRVRP